MIVKAILAFVVLLCLLIIFIVLNIIGVPKNVQPIVYAFLGVACLFLDGVWLLLALHSFRKYEKKSGKTKLDFHDYLKKLNGGLEVIRR